MVSTLELLSKIIYKPPCPPSADLCCSMLSLVSGCNLVASIASFICIISKQWSFSGSEGQFTDTGSQGCTVLSQKTSGSFRRSGQKRPRTTNFSLCLRIFEISIPNLTLEIVCGRLFEISPSTCSQRCGFLLIRPYVDKVFKQNR